MATQVFAYILHRDGKADDTALELLQAARRIDAQAEVTAIVAGHGAELEAVCGELSGFYGQVWKIDSEALDYVTADVLRALLVRVIPAGSLVVLAHEHFGMDLAPGLAVKLDAAYLPDATAIDGVVEGTLRAVREEFSGQVSTHMGVDVSNGAVITVRPGAFAAEASGGVAGQVRDQSAAALEGGVPDVRRRFEQVIAAEVGDVDITKSEVLVSVGRGIEDEENLELVEELAQAMGADVSCSRPIVDAKWMEKSRQVGTSGQTVKPKVYLALGISGSFQHMGGIKGNPFIIAINKNPKAPIFQVADVGIVEDILEFVPELTERVAET